MTYTRDTTLDADIATLSADYAKRRGLDVYDHETFLDEMFPHKERVPTTYPRADSNKPTRRVKTPRAKSA